MQKFDPQSPTPSPNPKAMGWLKHLRWKLFVSHLLIIVIGVIVLLFEIGLFPLIAIAAWIGLLPDALWDRLPASVRKRFQWASARPIERPSAVRRPPPVAVMKPVSLATICIEPPLPPQ